MATAVAIRHNRIPAVGRDDEILPLLAAGGEVLDLNGRCVTPGLVDAHVHFQHFALSLQRVDLRGTQSLDEALARVAAKLTTVHRSPTTDDWLQGRGWRVNDWGQTEFLTAAHLDAISKDVAICLSDHSGLRRPGQQPALCAWRASTVTAPIPWRTNPARRERRAHRYSLRRRHRPGNTSHPQSFQRPAGGRNA